MYVCIINNIPHVDVDFEYQENVAVLDGLLDVRLGLNIRVHTKAEVDEGTSLVATVDPPQLLTRRNTVHAKGVEYVVQEQEAVTLKATVHSVLHVLQKAHVSEAGALVVTRGGLGEPVGSRSGE